MILRRFNEAGIQKFREYLAAARSDSELDPPRELLQDEQLVENVGGMIRVERRNFVSRREAAEYLVNILSPLDDDDVRNDAGLWTWLALFFFDEICPPKNGERKVRNDYLYVFEPHNARNFYRHLLFLAWRALNASTLHNRLFLDVPVSRLDKITQTVFASLYITRITCIFEVLERLYWDAEQNRARAGVADGRRVLPGDLMHRLPIRIRQLEKTFDLQSLTADQLIELLGDEFQQWASDKQRTSAADVVGAEASE